MLATARRRRFADLDRNQDRYWNSNVHHRADRHDALVGPPVGPARVRHAQAPTYVEMGSGLAFAVGVALIAASMLILGVICGWAMLVGP